MARVLNLQVRSLIYCKKISDYWIKIISIITIVITDNNININDDNNINDDDFYNHLITQEFIYLISVVKRFPPSYCLINIKPS